MDYGSVFSAICETCAIGSGIPSGKSPTHICVHKSAASWGYDEMAFSTGLKFVEIFQVPLMALHATPRTAPMALHARIKAPPTVGDSTANHTFDFAAQLLSTRPSNGRVPLKRRIAKFYCEGMGVCCLGSPPTVSDVAGSSEVAPPG